MLVSRWEPRGCKKSWRLFMDLWEVGKEGRRDGERRGKEGWREEGEEGGEGRKGIELRQ